MLTRAVSSSVESIIVALTSCYCITGHCLYLYPRRTAITGPRYVDSHGGVAICTDLPWRGDAGKNTPAAPALSSGLALLWCLVQKDAHKLAWMRRYKCVECGSLVLIFEDWRTYQA